MDQLALPCGARWRALARSLPTRCRLERLMFTSPIQDSPVTPQQAPTQAHLVSILAIRALLAFGLVVGPALPTAALAAEWVAKGEDDGVILHSRQVEDSSLPEFRGTTTVAANIYQLAAVIDDLDRHCDWQKRCARAKQLQRISDSERLFYMRSEAPWPLQDRDTVLRGRVAGLVEGTDVWVRFESIRDSRWPALDGVVRMPFVRGHFRMSRIDDGHTRIEYQVHADPGGVVPAWAARLSAKQVPRDTLAGLRRHLPKVQGNYPAFMDKWKPKPPVQ
ncbi:MAG: hypothetical protein EXR77_09275 [Myxococcales bacterium]|nr:hypothetical protein [Myxococcales bacterium]